MVLTLEQQVCSLESAKRLKELEVSQESLFWHEYDQYGYSGIKHGCHDKERFWDIYSAFTVAELGLLLPKNYISKNSDDYKWMGYWWDWACYKRIVEGCDNEAEARAKMLIYLLENKLIKLEPAK
jgi:hypothetical protein